MFHKLFFRVVCDDNEFKGEQYCRFRRIIQRRSFVQDQRWCRWWVPIQLLVILYCSIIIVRSVLKTPRDILHDFIRYIYSRGPSRLVHYNLQLLWSWRARNLKCNWTGGETSTRWRNNTGQDAGTGRPRAAVGPVGRQDVPGRSRRRAPWAQTLGGPDFGVLEAAGGVILARSRNQDFFP